VRFGITPISAGLGLYAAGRGGPQGEFARFGRNGHVSAWLGWHK
jgi:hypothetical protein